MLLGYHASHEQFAAGELLNYVSEAQKAGFQAIMSSDHFNPWSVRQGHSAHVWSWLGSAIPTVSLPFGTLGIPGGWRYHPAVIAQAIATLCDMHPGRLRWVALGSGEYLNEHVVGQGWPSKEIRNERLRAGAETIRAMLSGNTVSLQNSFLNVDRARLWAVPEQPPLLYAAALSKKTAAWAGEWADGLLTVRMPPDELQDLIEAFYLNGGKGKPVIVQMQVSWAPSVEEARANAYDQWRNVVLDRTAHAELATPEEFDCAAQTATIDEVCGRMLVSSEAADFRRCIAEHFKQGVSEIYLHNVGRNQTEFLRFIGDHVLKDVVGDGW